MERHRVVEGTADLDFQGSGTQLDERFCKQWISTAAGLAG